jgi:hypothetical protein
MRKRVRASVTTAFLGPRWRSTCQNRACSALTFARLAAAAVSIRAVRNQRAPFRVLPRFWLPGRCCRDRALPNSRDGPRSETRSCPRRLRDDHLGRPAVDAGNANQPGQLFGKRDDCAAPPSSVGAGWTCTRRALPFVFTSRARKASAFRRCARSAPQRPADLARGALRKKLPAYGRRSVGVNRTRFLGTRSWLG